MTSYSSAEVFVVPTSPSRPSVFLLFPNPLFTAKKKIIILNINIQKVLRTEGNEVASMACQPSRPAACSSGIPTKSTDWQRMKTRTRYRENEGIWKGLITIHKILVS